MRIRTKTLIRKLEPYIDDMYAKVHHGELLMKESERRFAWRHLVLCACDNADEYYPVGEIPKYDWRDQRQVRMPKKWRIPKQVFVFFHHPQYICFHIVPHRDYLKIVTIKTKRQ